MPAEEGESEMSFFDHLDELRSHLFRMAISVVIVAGVLFAYRNEVMTEIFRKPMNGDWISNRMLCQMSAAFCFERIPIDLQSLSPGEQFNKALTYSLIGAVIICFPYLLWEIWRFIKPGLRNKEVKAVNSNVFWMSLLFFMGVSFGYYVVMPFSLIFFSQFTLMEGIENNWRIGELISFVSMVVLGSGLLFQLPVAVYYLSKIGILSSAFMRKYRRHSIVVILIIAGFITPPDPFSQVFLALPLYVLYEVSIYVCLRVEKAEKLAEAARIAGS